MFLAGRLPSPFRGARSSLQQSQPAPLPWHSFQVTSFWKRPLSLHHLSLSTLLYIILSACSSPLTLFSSDSSQFLTIAKEKRNIARTPKSFVFVTSLVINATVYYTVTSDIALPTRCWLKTYISTYIFHIYVLHIIVVVSSPGFPSRDKPQAPYPRIRKIAKVSRVVFQGDSWVDLHKQISENVHKIIT